MASTTATSIRPLLRRQPGVARRPGARDLSINSGCCAARPESAQTEDNVLLPRDHVDITEELWRRRRRKICELDYGESKEAIHFRLPAGHSRQSQWT